MYIAEYNGINGKKRSCRKDCGNRKADFRVGQLECIVMAII